MLEYEDYELLMDGLDALGAKAGSSRLMNGLIGTMLAKDEEERQEMKAQFEASQEQQREERLLKECIIIIKAKLLQMRDRAEVRLLGQVDSAS